MECNREEATRAKEIAEKKLSANDFSGAKRFALKAQTLYPNLKGLSQMLAMLMECNRDEATRAKEIAEEKLSANDVSGAKRFALKAQTLYPNLEGLSQMLAMLDVLLSAEYKIDGEADWYGILGVDPSADDETIKKQFRKLALMIHSDKNKSASADEAFRLISDARDFLSDNSNRIAYDLKRFPKTSQEHDHVPPAAASETGDSSKTSQEDDHVPPTAASEPGDSSSSSSSPPVSP